MCKLLDKQALEDFTKLADKLYKEERNEAGWILYEQVIGAHKKGEKLFNEKFLKKIYVTLCWFMKRRIKKVVDFKEFSDSICKPQNEKLLDKLSKKRLELLKKGEVKETLSQLRALFEKIKVMDSDSKLVSLSKTLHFLLPKLVMPMDRSFTYDFFIKKRNHQKNGPFYRYAKNLTTPPKKHIKKGEFKDFCRYFFLSYEIAKGLGLSEKKRLGNLPVPKLIDNAIIKNYKQPKK